MKTNDVSTIIHLPKSLRDEFKQQCKDEFISMSVKIRQLIMNDIKRKNKEKELEKIN